MFRQLRNCALCASILLWIGIVLFVIYQKEASEFYERNVRNANENQNEENGSPKLHHDLFDVKGLVIPNIRKSFPKKAAFYHRQEKKSRHNKDPKHKTKEKKMDRKIGKKSKYSKVSQKKEDQKSGKTKKQNILSALKTKLKKKTN